VVARPPSPPLLLALLGCLALAACGGGDGEEAGRPDRAPSETTQTTTSPADAREALEDTSRRPQIPKPIGSPPFRLVKEDIVRGRGARAKLGDNLTVHYVGIAFSSGEEFDASWNTGQPFSFQLGGPVIEGWNKGVVGMRPGGRRMLTIPPELGYGQQGTADGSIAPNETLVFVVDLLSID
jgi:peptidylprolyl isomerase